MGTTKRTIGVELEAHFDKSGGIYTVEVFGDTLAEIETEFNDTLRCKLIPLDIVKPRIISAQRSAYIGINWWNVNFVCDGFVCDGDAEWNEEIEEEE
jgi:hypothetical protein